jgi:hypothetical protein
MWSWSVLYIAEVDFARSENALTEIAWSEIACLEIA